MGFFEWLLSILLSVSIEIAKELFAQHGEAIWEWIWSKF